MKKNKNFLIALCLVCFYSCDQQKHVGQTKDTNQSTFQFSESPIPLGRINANFVKDISYGPYPENTFDIFLVESKKPTPLVIYIHGGGFLGGDKNFPYTPMWNNTWDFPSEVKLLLKNGISFATINYRLLAVNNDKEGVLKSMSDSKRCLQYIRSVSSKLNIDKNNILLAGSSAGGGTSQWLAFSDDMADPQNADPVLRESTRVKAIAVKATQASYDLMRFQTDVFKEYDFSLEEYLKVDKASVPRFLSFYGMESLEDFNSERVKEYRKKVDMLAMMSPDDPEIWVANEQKPVVKPTKSNILNHHAFHARTLKEWADSIGIKNVVYYDNYKDPSGESFVDFMIRKLNKD